MVIVMIIVIVGVYKIWSISESGQLTLDKIKLKIPVIKYFNRAVAVVQFSQTLGLLLESGVNIAEALEIVVQIVDNQILVEALKKAQDNIIKQGKVTEYLQKTHLFSSVDVHLIGTGEQSGALDTMLIQVGKYNQEDLKEFSAGLTALLNPLSMAILAVVVGTIIIGVMAPLTDMSSMMGGS
jgi:type II secretory pathway component PulF